MRIEAAARRYAQAAFSVALEHDEVERWAEDLDALATLTGEPRAAAFLSSDKAPAVEKRALLEAALSGASPRAMNLAQLLVDKRRIDLADQIRQGFHKLLDEHRGIARATVTTAIPMLEDEARTVAARLSEITEKQVIVQPQVDPGILGGLVARIGDTLIDGSVRSRLLALKRQLEGLAP
jgi:F-type H+-transporting ATPase subunit delta